MADGLTRQPFDHDELDGLRTHPAWRLLKAETAPLVLGFLGRVFVDEGRSAVPAVELTELLDDELYALNARLGAGTYPRAASAYLEEWAHPGKGWLRKYYVSGSDEPRFDATPAVEKARLWVEGLRFREFVGTESRLHMMVELLRQLVHGSDADPQGRLEHLYRRRAELDAEIAQTETGRVPVLDAVSLRDRYQQFGQMARGLLADFREVEENFRRLDRELREQIAGWDGPKGALLDHAVTTRASIAESDQGRSFQAFYDFLLSYDRQEELTDLLNRLHHDVPLPERDDRLARVHFDWMDASERTQGTVRMLSEQFRRFLDDQAWADNRRISELIRHVEAKALHSRDVAGSLPEMSVDALGVTFNLPTARPLYRQTKPPAIDSTLPDRKDEAFDPSVLVEQPFVDRQLLRDRLLQEMGGADQVGLGAVVAANPLEQGLAELVGYLSATDLGVDVVFDPAATDTVEWTDDDVARHAVLPRVTFLRSEEDR